MISQKQAKSSLLIVAKELVEKGKVSFLGVFGEYGIRGLHQRISELRDCGFNIGTISVKGDCVYELIKAPPKWQEKIASYKLEIKSKRPKLRALNNV